MAKKFGRIYNARTRQLIVPDPVKIRLARMRRRIFHWVEMMQTHHQKGLTRLVMVTLTYAPENDWKANHMRDFMLAFRRSIGADNLLAYAWVGELQRRGVPHYHLIMLVKKGTDIPKPDESGVWPWGMSQIKTAKTAYYLVSYLKKEYQKEGQFPKGMRMFAVWVKKSLVDLIDRLQYYWFRMSSFPIWVTAALVERDILGRRPHLVLMRQLPKPKRGGGYHIVDPLAGGQSIDIPSPWVVL